MDSRHDERGSQTGIGFSMREVSYFLSDAHIGAGYITDPGEHERRLVALLHEMEKDAEAVYLLGDILDFWFEYHHVVPKGHVRLFGQIARMTDMGIRVYWFRGNHDMWTYTYLRDELGVTVIDEDLITDIHGKRFFLSHGDNLGPQPKSYRAMRSVFRSPFWQAVGRALHPSWLMSFGFSWSSHNRLKHTPTQPEYRGDDVEPQMIFATEFSAEHPDIDYFVMGHNHVAVIRPVPMSEHAQYVCLGDFFTLFTFGRFSKGKGFEILTNEQCDRKTGELYKF